MWQNVNVDISWNNSRKMDQEMGVQLFVWMKMLRLCPGPDAFLIFRQLNCASRPDLQKVGLILKRRSGLRT